MRILFLIFLAVAAFIVSLSNTGCANIVPPTGGPRDSTAPVLLAANPEDSTTNFRGNRLTFTFDEYVDFDNSATMMFTPTLQGDPAISVRLRTVTVRFKETDLLPNTTYTFDFGNAITDVNERNAYRNFVYRFSTGPVLDSLTFSGNVVLAETGGIDSTIIIGLYKNLADSAAVKQGPLYITRVDNKGKFRFTNLPADTFAVYAFGGQAQPRYRRYNTSELFAFADEQVIIRDSTGPVTLFAYHPTPKPAGTTATAPPAARGDNRLRFNTNIQGNQLGLRDDLVVTFTTPLRTLDSTKIALSTDSTYSPAVFTSSLDTTEKILRIESQWRPGTTYNLILDRDFAADTAGRQLLKSDTLYFTTKKTEDYGRLVIRLRNVDLSLRPVLQFVTGGQVVESIPLSSNVVERALFAPGEYSLRILYDENGNGKWDPGRFPEGRKQPERVVPIERQITVKPAWDNDFDISL